MKNSIIQIEYRPTAELKPYARKLRKHDHAVDQMVASLREFDFKVPILVRGKEIVDGHLRLKAAIKLRFTEVPVIRCDGWTEAQVQAFRLMANQSANWATWDLDLVAQELAELKSVDFDLGLTGFSGNEIDQMLFAGDDAIAPEPEAEPVSRLGDVWHCGEHRVLCGDATDAAAVERLLQQAKPRLMIADSPYGVMYKPQWREEAGLGRQRRTGIVANDDRIDWAEAYLLFPGDVAYVWHAGLYAGQVAAALEASGFRIRSQIIWAKQQFALGRSDYHWQHEPCWYAVRDGSAANWCGDRTQSTLWQVPNLNPFGGSRDEEATGHGTQKPVELMRRPILNHTAAGESVYDPFLGSGTTLIAAEETARVCFGVEIEPRYVDVIVKRWQNLTGRAAVLADSGVTFDQIQQQRGNAAK